MTRENKTYNYTSGLNSIAGNIARQTEPLRKISLCLAESTFSDRSKHFYKAVKKVCPLFRKSEDGVSELELTALKEGSAMSVVDLLLALDYIKAHAVKGASGRSFTANVDSSVFEHLERRADNELKRIHSERRKDAWELIYKIASIAGFVLGVLNYLRRT